MAAERQHRLDDRELKRLVDELTRPDAEAEAPGRETLANRLAMMLRHSPKAAAMASQRLVPSFPGQRALVDALLTSTPKLEFADCQAMALRDVLRTLSKNRGLREATLAAADRRVAQRVAPHEHRAEATHGGQAMWGAANQRAVTLYRRATTTGIGAPETRPVSDAIGAIGTGAPLPADVRRKLEAVFGVSLDRVRLHTGSVAHDAAAAVCAEAFTVGEDIFFPAYDPTSLRCQETLVHEVVHCVQWRQGRIPTPQPGGPAVSRPHDPLEREAERAAKSLVATAFRRPALRRAESAAKPPRVPLAVTADASPQLAMPSRAPGLNLVMRQAKSGYGGDVPLQLPTEADNEQSWDDLKQSVLLARHHIPDVGGEYAQYLANNWKWIGGVFVGFIAVNRGSKKLTERMAKSKNPRTVLAAAAIQAFTTVLPMAAGLAGTTATFRATYVHAETWVELGWNANGDRDTINAASKECVRFVVSLVTAIVSLGVTLAKWLDPLKALWGGASESAAALKAAPAEGEVLQMVKTKHGHVYSGETSNATARPPAVQTPQLRPQQANNRRGLEWLPPAFAGGAPSEEERRALDEEEQAHNQENAVDGGTGTHPQDFEAESEGAEIDAAQDRSLSSVNLTSLPKPQFTAELELQIAREGFAAATTGKLSDVAKKYGVTVGDIVQLLKEAGGMVSSAPRAFKLDERLEILGTLEGKTDEEREVAIAAALANEKWKGLTPDMIIAWLKGRYTKIEKYLILSEIGPKPEYKVRDEYGLATMTPTKWRAQLNWTGARYLQGYSEEKIIEILRYADDHTTQEIWEKYRVEASIFVWRRKYNWKSSKRPDDAAKRTVVREMAERGNRTVADVGKDHHFHEVTLHKWANEFDPQRHERKNLEKEALKAEVLRRLDQGHSVRNISDDLKIPESTIRKWKKQQIGETGDGKSPVSEQPTTSETPRPPVRSIPSSQKVVAEPEQQSSTGPVGSEVMLDGVKAKVLLNMFGKSIWQVIPDPSSPYGAWAKSLHDRYGVSVLVNSGESAEWNFSGKTILLPRSALTTLDFTTESHEVKHMMVDLKHSPDGSNEMWRAEVRALKPSRLQHSHPFYDKYVRFDELLTNLVEARAAAIACVTPQPGVTVRSPHHYMRRARSFVRAITYYAGSALSHDGTVGTRNDVTFKTGTKQDYRAFDYTVTNSDESWSLTVPAGQIPEQYWGGDRKKWEVQARRVAEARLEALVERADAADKILTKYLEGTLSEDQEKLSEDQEKLSVTEELVSDLRTVEALLHGLPVKKPGES